MTVKGSAANGRSVKAAGNGTCTGALVTARLAEGTTGDNGFAGGIPPASKNKAPEMIVLITGAPGGHWQPTPPETRAAEGEPGVLRARPETSPGCADDSRAGRGRDPALGTYPGWPQGMHLR